MRHELKRVFVDATEGVRTNAVLMTSKTQLSSLLIATKRLEQFMPQYLVLFSQDEMEGYIHDKMTRHPINSLKDFRNRIEVLIAGMLGAARRMAIFLK